MATQAWPVQAWPVQAPGQAQPQEPWAEKFTQRGIVILGVCVCGFCRASGFWWVDFAVFPTFVLDCFTLRVVAVDPSSLSPSFAGTCVSSFMCSAGTCFRMAPAPTQGPWGGHRVPPRAQGALWGPWGWTALRTLRASPGSKGPFVTLGGGRRFADGASQRRRQELLFGFSWEMFSMSAVIQIGPECPRKAPICQTPGRGIRRRGI